MLEDKFEVYKNNSIRNLICNKLIKKRNSDYVEIPIWIAKDIIKYFNKLQNVNDTIISSNQEKR